MSKLDIALECVVFLLLLAALASVPFLILYSLVNLP